VIGIPLSYVFCFKYNLGIKGIWVGPTVAVAMNTLAYILIFYCLDWDTLIEEAVKKREDYKLQEAVKKRKDYKLQLEEAVIKRLDADDYYKKQ
jgi:hypothetical protein